MVNKLFAFPSISYINGFVADTKPIPVRIDESVIERLDAVAHDMGNTRAGVIKLCIASFLDYFEANGGVAALPLDWEQVLAKLDGRTVQSRKTAGRSAPGADRAQVFNEVSSRQVSDVARASMDAAERAADRILTSERKRKAAAPSANKRAPKRGGGKGS